jgi:hypothetical protein
MLNRKLAFAACAAGTALAVMAISLEGGSNPEHTTYLTFNTPFALPGIGLPPGTYVFELVTPGVRTDLVRVLSRDRSQVHLTAFTRLVERPEGLRADRQVTFGEARRGAPPPITAWYPIGESVGHQFIYPPRSRQLIGFATN